VPDPAQTGTAGKLMNLHLLRAIAALAVVYFHITSEAGLDLPLNIGAHGVDIFFVVSGFIIAYIGPRAPRGFLIRRLIRIVPFYWTATLVVFAAAVLMPSVFRSTQADYVQLFHSLAFLPRETAYAGMFPTLILGWSLNYEMYFYVIFAAALLAAPRLAPALSCLVIVIAMAAIDLSGVSHPSVLFYARPIVFEFIFGIAVFYVYTTAERHADRLQRQPLLRAGLAAAAIASLLTIGIEEYFQGFGLPRYVSAGLPASVLVLGALLLERVFGVSFRSKGLFLVGESSYILYLIHPYVVYGVLRTVLRGTHLVALPAIVGLIIALLAISTVAAIAIHVWLERPCMAWLRIKLQASDAPAP
jgi:exopolysaccharide production protein ExoZ